MPSTLQLSSTANKANDDTTTKQTPPAPPPTPSRNETADELWLPNRDHAAETALDGMTGAGRPSLPFGYDVAGMTGASGPEAKVCVYVMGIQDVLVGSTSEGTQYVVTDG
jgi:hypothetical protein